LKNSTTAATDNTRDYNSLKTAHPCLSGAGALRRCGEAVV